MLIWDGPSEMFDDTTTVVPVTPTSYGAPMKLGDMTEDEIKREIDFWHSVHAAQMFDRDDVCNGMFDRFVAYLKTRQLQAV